MEKNIAKRVQLYGYTRNNVGDDIFIYSLVKSFPNIEFCININKVEYTKAFQNLENLTIKIQPNVLEVSVLDNIDACVYIAGSIFMEKGNALTHLKQLLQFVEQCKQKNIPYYFISSNYGPYITQEYFDISKKLFTNCTDICFRDKYSYNLFRDVQSVRYAPDYLFSYNVEQYINKIEKDTVGISVIDMDIRPHLQVYENTYIDCIVNNIIEYIKEDLSVTLISFCEHEGDVKGIDKIIARLPQKCIEQVKVLEYKGNIEEFLQKYSKFEYVLCTRFHSMVLSTILEQKTYCLSYSDKLDNVIKDLEIYTDFARIDSISNTDIFDISNFARLNNMNKNEIICLSNEQIKGFRGFLKLIDKM